MMSKKDILQDDFTKSYAEIFIINLDFFDENSILNKDLKEQMQETLRPKIP